MARERVRLRYELDMASIRRRELLDEMRYNTEAQRTCQELLELEVRIDVLSTELEQISGKQVAEKFETRSSHISSMTTARYR
jgi:hypothetical protein